jgi:hypothetical protein
MSGACVGLFERSVDLYLELLCNSKCDVYFELLRSGEILAFFVEQLTISQIFASLKCVQYLKLSE